VRLFLKVLREGLRLAESADSAKYGFKPGDAEHLRRWLADKRATIFAKLTKRHKLTEEGIVQHIMSVLGYRQLAEDTDRLNATFAELKKTAPRLAKKERRRATKVFADGGVPQGALDDYLDYVNEIEARSSGNLDPLFIVRSDRSGSRKRTIFCRTLSRLIHINFGRWHDAEVAALCEIAFDCDVTIETVKDARKGMRSSKPRSP
jgi:hypothetical protein